MFAVVNKSPVPGLAKSQSSRLRKSQSSARIPSPGPLCISISGATIWHWRRAYRVDAAAVHCQIGLYTCHGARIDTEFSPRATRRGLVAGAGKQLGLEQRGLRTRRHGRADKPVSFFRFFFSLHAGEKAHARARALLPGNLIYGLFLLYRSAAVRVSWSIGYRFPAIELDYFKLIDLGEIALSISLNCKERCYYG